MSERKTIKVNPAFFSLKPTKNKTEKKRNKREKLKKMSQIIRPNKAKKELLKRIKEHQKQKKEQQKKESSENVIEFTENMKESMDYLQKIIKENKKKKQLKRTQKNYHSNKNKILINQSQDIKPNISLEIKPTEIHLDDLQKDNNIIKPSLVVHEQKGGLTNQNGTIPPLTLKNPINTEEPKYGCLKGGNKPTYREYMKTLKKRDVQPISIPKFNNNSTNDKEIIERKNKLKSLIEKSSTTNHKIKDDKKMGSYRRYKVRTLHKTYKIGKYKGKKNVGILLKNNTTRKKIIQEIGILEKTPISKVKAFLREKNLLKIGSKVPDNIVRQTFINTILSGDVINKNYKMLLHNYVN